MSGDYMKKYVIICKTMNRAKRLWESTLYSLGDLVRSFDAWSIRSIEIKDDVALYFVSTYYWYEQGGRLGRHDWKPLGENYFRGMLDKWKESRR